MKSFPAVFILVSFAFQCFPQDSVQYKYSSVEYSFPRVFEAAKKTPKWINAKNITERYWAIYDAANRYSVSSKPVSDRYALTCYGGPIDLMHFFGLAAQVSTGSKTLEEFLYLQWIDEGGPENIKKFNHKEPPEAHPDDLPSNALGSLFSQELIQKKADLNSDIQKEFEEFIAPLLPVPDKVAKEFSHREIVMGWPDNPSDKQREEKLAWFTAEPMICCDKINTVAKIKLGHPLCKDFTKGKDALEFAGFRIEKYKEQTIITRRAEKK